MNTCIYCFVIEICPTEHCALPYLVKSFKGGEVVHLLWLTLHLHVASSFSVDTFMPESARDT